MSLLLYCIIPAGASLPACVGVDGAAASLIRAELVSAVVSPLSGPLSREVASLLQYEKLIATVHQTHTTIPLRYGTVCADDGIVRAHLAEEARRYVTLLSRLEGCVEMGLRGILPVEAAPPPAAQSATTPSSGRAFLQARMAHYAANTETLTQATRRWGVALEGLFVTSRQEDHAFGRRQLDGKPTVSVYYLVHREKLSAFQHACARLIERDAAQLLLSGPWPPYNFVAG